MTYRNAVMLRRSRVKVNANLASNLWPQLEPDSKTNHPVLRLFTGSLISVFKVLMQFALRFFAAFAPFAPFAVRNS
jgi:hypothetical protein